jgi:hypothetical protein
VEPIDFNGELKNGGEVLSHEISGARYNRAENKASRLIDNFEVPIFIIVFIRA